MVVKMTRRQVELIAKFLTEGGLDFLPNTLIKDKISLYTLGVNMKSRLEGPPRPDDEDDGEE